MGKSNISFSIMDRIPEREISKEADNLGHTRHQLDITNMQTTHQTAKKTNLLKVKWNMIEDR